MEENRTITTDLKNLEHAVPRKRLLAYVAALVLIPAFAVWALMSGRGPAVEEGAEGTATQEAQEGVAPSEAGEGSAAPAPARQPSSGVAAPAPGVEWRSVTSADGKYRMDLPAGTTLTQDASGFTYVVPESPAGALPHMAIKIATGVDKQGYRPNPANSVMLDIGRETYWLYTWQFKAWDPFVRIVASFKVL